MNVCIVRAAYFPDDPRDRKQALALRDAGHRVEVLCLNKGGQLRQESVEGIDVFRLPIRHRREGVLSYLLEYSIVFLAMSFLVTWRFARVRYRCIQVSTMPDFLVFCTIAPRILGARILLDVHEPTPELWTTKYGGRLRWLGNLQARIEQWAIRYAHATFTVTKALRQRLVERGARRERIVVIPNVCEESFDRAGEKAPRNGAANQGPIRLVTHGLIEKRYGHGLLIEAVHEARKNGAQVSLDIVGDGEYRPELDRIIKKLGGGDWVRMLGFVPFSELLETLCAADVGVVAMERSPYSELIETNKMYEYIALRKPVIVPRLAALEQSFDDTSLMFFEPGNRSDLARCIQQLFLEPERRRALVEAASRRYEAVHWSVTGRTYVGVFERVENNEWTG